MSSRPPPWPPPDSPSGGPEVEVPSSRRAGAKRWAARRAAELEARPRAGVPLAMLHRFSEIDGKQLASLLTLGLLVAAVPLLVMLYAYGSTVAGDSGSFGDALVTQFGLSGGTAGAVRDTFASATASRSSATVLTILGLVYGGLDIAIVVHTAFARAFRIPPMVGLQRIGRGLLWFVVLIANLALTEAIGSNLIDKGPLLRGAALILQMWLAFAFWLVTPRLLLHRQLGVPGLIPMAIAGTVITFVTRATSRVWFPHLLEGYTTPFGPFGVVLSLVSWGIILATSWILVACLGAVLWERFSDPALVRSIEGPRPGPTP